MEKEKDKDDINQILTLQQGEYPYCSYRHIKGSAKQVINTIENIITLMWM